MEIIHISLNSLILNFKKKIKLNYISDRFSVHSIRKKNSSLSLTTCIWLLTLIFAVWIGTKVEYFWHTPWNYADCINLLCCQNDCVHIPYFRNCSIFGSKTHTWNFVVRCKYASSINIELRCLSLCHVTMLSIMPCMHYMGMERHRCKLWIDCADCKQVIRQAIIVIYFYQFN